MKDGAVVVLYNPQKDEYKNILNYAGKVDKTLIIDNSPSNNLEDIQLVMKVDGEKILYKHFPENIGLCKGMNIGIKELAGLGCQWVMTMNSDSHFKTDMLAVFRDYVKNSNCSNIALLSPQFNFDRHPIEAYRGAKKVTWVMMSGNYVNTQIFIKLNGYLEELFVDGLDTEYCLWANKNGYEIIECGEAVLEHMPATTKDVKLFEKTIFKYGVASPKRYGYQAKALVYTIRKYHTFHEVVVYFYKLIKIIFLFENKREYLMQFMKGTQDGLKLKGR